MKPFQNPLDLIQSDEQATAYLQAVKLGSDLPAEQEFLRSFTALEAWFCEKRRHSSNSDEQLARARIGTLSYQRAVRMLGRLLEQEPRPGVLDQTHLPIGITPLKLVQCLAHLVSCTEHRMPNSELLQFGLTPNQIAVLLALVRRHLLDHHHWRDGVRIYTGVVAGTRVWYTILNHQDRGLARTDAFENLRNIGQLATILPDQFHHVSTETVELKEISKAWASWNNLRGAKPLGAMTEFCWRFNIGRKKGFQWSHLAAMLRPLLRVHGFEAPNAEVQVDVKEIAKAVYAECHA